MTGEFSSGRDSSGSEVAPGLRASHADRDRVVELLRVAAGDGRLTVAELEERLETALTARTAGELAALTTDLPAEAALPGGTPGQAKDLLRIDQSGGSVMRTGRWVVPRRMEIRTTYSNVHLDFTEALITQDTLRIDLVVRGGSLTLVTRPGIVVEADDLTVEYAKVKLTQGADAHERVTLRVELNGSIGFGKVVERQPRRTFWQWLTHKPRPGAPHTPALE